MTVKILQALWALVERPELTQQGRWMAAVLACGETAVLSHLSAAAHWRMVDARPGPIHISVPPAVLRRRRGIRVHRSTAIDPPSVTRRLGIPVTKPVLTLVNLAAVLDPDALERAFRPIVRRAGLPKPTTRERLNGYRVDFCWPELGLVVETDSLTYHRTPAQQTTDRRRDQARLRHKPEAFSRL